MSVIKLAEQQAEESRKPTQSQLLVELSAPAELFHTPEGDTYATIPIGDHRETDLIRSTTFRQWIIKLYYDRYGRPPCNQSLLDAFGVIEGGARFDGPEYNVFTRVAAVDGAIYIDLANEKWQAIEIKADDWRIVSDPPVRFRRTKGMLPIPLPVRGGTLDELRPLLNIEDEDGWHLIVGWLVGGLRPKGPYIVLVIQGEQGSAKSVGTRLIRMLIDPASVPLSTVPRSEHDYAIAACNGWVVALDNLSGLVAWLSDMICRTATGGGMRTRQLYSDNQETLLNITRPVILNGIANIVTRPDLLDRCIIVKLPRIENYKEEENLLAEFEAARPRIFGALLDAVSAALRNLPTTHLKRAPRMADAARWITAAESALPWPPGAFLASYTGNRDESTALALEADPVAGAVIKFMETRDTWEGTSSQLLLALNALIGIDHSVKSWPADATRLSTRLTILGPALRTLGIETDRGTAKGAKRGQRTLQLCRRSVDAVDAEAVFVDAGVDAVSVSKHKSGDAGDAGDAKYPIPSVGFYGKEEEERESERVGKTASTASTASTRLRDPGDDDNLGEPV